MDHNIDESAPYLVGNGKSALAQLQEWRSGELGLGIYYMPWSTRSCLWRLWCMDNPQRDAVLECLSLANILLVALELRAYLVITRSTVPQNNGNLPLPFFGGNYPTVLLNNIYSLLYMYINWFTIIIFIHDCICYARDWG